MKFHRFSKTNLIIGKKTNLQLLIIRVEWEQQRLGYRKFFRDSSKNHKRSFFWQFCYVLNFSNFLFPRLSQRTNFVVVIPGRKTRDPNSSDFSFKLSIIWTSLLQLFTWKALQMMVHVILSNRDLLHRTEYFTNSNNPLPEITFNKVLKEII